MRYDWMDSFLLSKAGVTKDLLDKSYELVSKGFSKKKQSEYYLINI